MKKILSLCLAVSLLAAAFGGTSAYAADDEGKLRIVEPIGDKTLLMSDGSMWTWDATTMVHTQGNFSAAAGKDDLRGVAMTQDGRAASWAFGRPKILPNIQSGVRQVTLGYFLKSDGTVWTEFGQVKDLSDIALIDAYSPFLAALSRKGDVLYGDDTKTTIMGTVSDPASVVSIAVTSHMLALLFNSGKVVAYDTANFDDYGHYYPTTVTEDAVHIAYAAKTNAPMGVPDKLIITRKDGSVWITGNYNKRFTPTTKIEGLSDIVRTAAFKDENRFYAEKRNGDWILFDNGEIKSVEVPSVKKLSVALSNPEPNVGESVKIDILETYTNGAKIKVEPTETNTIVEKPHLLKLQADGSLKVLGVGESKITVNSGGQTTTVLSSSSLGHNLKFAKQVKGVAYVPLKSVIQALGGSVTKSTAAGAYDVTAGETKITLTTGDANATVNGEPYRMKTAVIEERGEILIPASLLADRLGASVKWNDKWKQVDIAFGKSVMTVVSADTAAIVKKALQGSLANYIGKSYWFNHFEDYERFMKVTIVDIVPDDTGDFNIVFKTSSGKKLTTDPMKSSFIPELLGESDFFLSYDPYKKHKWSASVWKHIKAEEVVLGMTKDQVKLAWGSPASKTVTSANGKKIEVWVYGNFDSVGFVNDSVVLIYS